jgi:hypothetical protein
MVKDGLSAITGRSNSARLWLNSFSPERTGDLGIEVSSPRFVLVCIVTDL